MKRTGCIVAAALLLGLLLAGITGYFIWHSAQDKYVRAEMVGVSGGTGVAGVEAPEPEEGDGAETGAAADSDGLFAYRLMDFSRKTQPQTVEE